MYSRDTKIKHLVFSTTNPLPVLVSVFSMEYRQLCLIRTDVDPKFLSGLGKIRIVRIGIICIGRDRYLPICPV